MALNDMRDDWEKKIFSTIFSEKDTTSDEYCLSANMGPEYLYKEDIEESLENYYSGYGIEDYKRNPDLLTHKEAETLANLLVQYLNKK